MGENENQLRRSAQWDRCAFCGNNRLYRAEGDAKAQRLQAFTRPVYFLFALKRLGLVLTSLHITHVIT